MIYFPAQTALNLAPKPNRKTLVGVHHDLTAKSTQHVSTIGVIHLNGGINTQATTFPYFNRLPTELRITIIQYAAVLDDGDHYVDPFPSKYFLISLSITCSRYSLGGTELWKYFAELLRFRSFDTVLSLMIASRLCSEFCLKAWRDYVRDISGSEIRGLEPFRQRLSDIKETMLDILEKMIEKYKVPASLCWGAAASSFYE